MQDGSPQGGFESEGRTRLPRREVLRGLWPLFRQRLGHFIGCFLLLMVWSGLVVVGPLLVKRAIDVDIAARDLHGLRMTVLLFLGTQLLHMIVFYVLRNWLEWTGQGMMAVLKQRLVAHLIALPLAFHDRHPPGRLLSRVENDAEALRQLFTTTSVMLLGDVFLFAGMFVAMASVSPRLMLITIAVVPTLAITGYRIQKRAHPLFLELRRLTADICGRLAEFLQGIAVIQGFARRAWATEHFEALNRERFEVNAAGEKIWVLWFNVVVLLQSIAFALILGIGGYWALGGLVTIGTLAMFLGYVRRFFEPIFRISDQFASIQRALTGAERIQLLLREPLVVKDPDHPVTPDPVGSGICFEHVWFRYGEGNWVLQDVSFEIPAGERWALVGATGSGKTTIASLMLRFYDPVQGRVLVDGVDVRDLAQQELRRRVGLVLQDLYLFPGDLEANLVLGRGLTPGQIERAARLTLATEVIARIPGGLRGELAERGANLSMGERQLLSFTRAVAHEPSILVLDEATSAVDPETEARIEASLANIVAGRTALIIAHRLSTVRSADRILVLRGGRIVESGSHDELLAAGGVYHALHGLQFGTEVADVRRAS